MMESEATETEYIATDKNVMPAVCSGHILICEQIGKPPIYAGENEREINDTPSDSTKKSKTACD